MRRAADLQGLSPPQVQQRRQRYGGNGLPPAARESFWEQLKGNFDDPLIKILLTALAVTLTLAFFGVAEWVEGVGIGVAVFIATFVATLSEYKNEESFQSLQEEAGRVCVAAIRGERGAVILIPIDEVVVGDLLLLEAGDKVPADGLLLTNHLLVDQSSLTGEAALLKKLPPKESPLSDGGVTPSSSSFSPVIETDFYDESALFRGSVVSDGEGVMLVQAVGTSTSYGRLALELAAHEDRESPLQLKLSILAEQIARLSYVGAALIALSFLFKQYVIDQGWSFAATFTYLTDTPLVALQEAVTAVTLAVIIVVVAVPEGLPMMISIVLSLNMRRLLRSNVLVRRLMGIETAGSLSLLFADKTGTLTKGKFEPLALISGSCESFVRPEDIPTPLRAVVAFTIQEGTPSIRNPETGDILGGNTSDQAILQYLHSLPPLSSTHSGEVEVVREVSFNSRRKFAAVQLSLSPSLLLRYPVLALDPPSAVGDGDYFSIVKGAPEILLPHCSWQVTVDGKVSELDPHDRDALCLRMDEVARRGERLILLTVTHERLPLEDDECPKNLILVGVLCVGDELRPSSIPAIERCRGAGVQTVMITGDKKETAVAIATQLGLLGNHFVGDHHSGDEEAVIIDISNNEQEDVVLTSDTLSVLSDHQLSQLLPRLRVVARALPTDKSRLVRVAQAEGHVVGMTGDGVNDSAALKVSDVGFAMGSAVEVAKEAADIVILDDHFASIADAILYGRTIFHSIRKFIIFQSTVNLASLLIVFLGPFLGFDFPLSLIQLLWVNLVMDTLAALAYGGEPANSRYMDAKPLSRSAPIISFYMWSSIISSGVFIFLLSVFFLTHDYVRAQFVSEESFLTAYFCFFIFSTNFNSLNVRTKSLSLFANVKENINFVIVLLFIFAVQISFTYIGGEWLKTTPLTSSEWTVVILLSLLVIPFDLLRKRYYSSLKKLCKPTLSRYVQMSPPSRHR